MGLPGPVTRSSPAPAVQSAPHFPFVPQVMSRRLVLEPPAQMAVPAAGGAKTACQAPDSARISVPERASWRVVTSTVTWPDPWAPAKIPVLARPSTW